MNAAGNGASRTWLRQLSSRDRDIAIQTRAGLGRTGMGNRPALLVVDMTRRFCGWRPSTDSTPEGWRTGYLREAWSAVDAIVPVLAEFRRLARPVIFARPLDARPPALIAPASGKAWEPLNAGETTDAIVDELTPLETEFVVDKAKPSAFFGTPLASYLFGLGVDGLVVCGTATSGCVFATVLDAFSYNFRVSLVEDGTFDRYASSHDFALFSVDAKYGDVVASADILAALGRSPGPTEDFDRREEVSLDSH